MGRRSDNDVVIDETTASQRHALIMESPDGFVLRDLNTTNRTFVNQEKVGRQETTLKHGDTIRLAGSEVTLIFHQEGPATVTMDREPAATGAFVREPFQPQSPPASEAPEPEPKTDEKDASLLTLLESRRRTVLSRPEIIRHVWPELSGSSQVDYVIDQSIERLRIRIEYDPLKTRAPVNRRRPRVPAALRSPINSTWS